VSVSFYLVYVLHSHFTILHLISFKIVSHFQRKIDEPIHILNIGIRYEVREEDYYYAAIFEDFCAEQVSLYLQF